MQDLSFLSFFLFSFLFKTLILLHKKSFVLYSLSFWQVIEQANASFIFVCLSMLNSISLQLILLLYLLFVFLVNMLKISFNTLPTN